MAAAVRNGVQTTAQPGSILLVIHNFVARSADELSLAKGDRIELIERDDDFGDGWFLGRHLGNGNTGLFPEVYTTPAPKGTLTGAHQQRRVSESASKSAASTSSESPNMSPTQTRHSSGPGPSVRAQYSPLSPTTLRSSGPASTYASAPKLNAFNVDSPVMNETLSVIDEHITDLKGSHPSHTNGNKRDTMSSMYSQPMGRLSYVPGHETEEDEGVLHTEDEVMAWSPMRVAEYLEDHGVERSHCEVFKEQEISGEVLLAMDQSSLFIKEFDLGPVGRRLKTWHKIKALQDEVKRSNVESGRGLPDESDAAEGAVDGERTQASDAARNRSSTMDNIVPRGLEPTGWHNSDVRRSNTLQSSALAIQEPTTNPTTITRSPSTAISPLQSMTSISRPENTYRPSAQSIRQMQHSRRHSSIDSTSSAGGVRNVGHQKKPSVDSRWNPGQAMSQVVSGKIATVALGTSDSASDLTKTETNGTTPASPGDLDRGYFSDNQSFSRHGKGATLKKSPSAAVSPLQSRANSFMYSNRSATHSGSAGALQTDSLGAGTSMPMADAIDTVQSRWSSAQRSTTSPQLISKPFSEMRAPSTPVVTKLDPGSQTSLTPAARTGASDTASTAEPSPTSAALSFFAAQKQRLGLRTASEGVTKGEKAGSEAGLLPDEGRALASPSRTGSTTPSTETRSFDLQKSMDGQSRRTSAGSGGKSGLPTTVAQRRPRAKTKKLTSAYTSGLEKITFAEQLKRTPPLAVDYSGWMKKKSGSLMSTWKPRLFVLRGRRLSYYYHENDTEEKGLIDISFHRVLPATNETLTGIHAAVTGAAGSPTSPTRSSTTMTAAERDLKSNLPKPGESPSDGIFIFKLVPPKSGLAKGVNFTKPTVHYFAVGSRQEGRLWMAALMKATIDRDDDGLVTTTYNQKTISLAKARARKERPPALKEEEDGDALGVAELDGSEAVTPEAGSERVGLGIGDETSTVGEEAADGIGGATENLPVEEDINAEKEVAHSLTKPLEGPTVATAAAEAGAENVLTETEVASPTTQS